MISFLKNKLNFSISYYFMIYNNYIILNLNSSPSRSLYLYLNFGVLSFIYNSLS